MHNDNDDDDIVKHIQLKRRKKKIVQAHTHIKHTTHLVDLLPKFSVKHAKIVPTAVLCTNTICSIDGCLLIFFFSPLFQSLKKNIKKNVC